MTIVQWTYHNPHNNPSEYTWVNYKYHTIQRIQTSQLSEYVTKDQ